METSSPLVQVTKAIDRSLWPKHRVVLTRPIKLLLELDGIRVADVGAADGPEDRWRSISGLATFLTFEPNPRSNAPVTTDDTLNFSVGLFSAPGRHTLQLTEHIDSSSIYPANQSLFADFLVADAMKVVGTMPIEVDTFDHCLEGHPTWAPDFFKVDVEGGDLEVLRGAERALAQSVLGVRMETAFVPVRIGAPLFDEMDRFMRERGFVLFHLGQNHWIRKNNHHGYASAPQLIWGDAIYFLSREAFLKRLSTLNQSIRDQQVAKFVTLLLCHNIHDFAIEIIEAAAKANLSPAVAAQLRQSVENSMTRSPLHVLWLAVGVGYALTLLAASLPFSGLRTRAMFYVRQRVAHLGRTLMRWGQMAGYPKKSVIEDVFV